MALISHNFYTVGSVIVNLPVKDAFVICKDVCGKIKQAKVKEIDENRFFIKGKSKASMHSYGEKFLLFVTNHENSSNIVVYYNHMAIGGGPARKDFIDPLFTELGKQVQLNGMKTEVQNVPKNFFENLIDQKMEEKDQADDTTIKKVHVSPIFNISLVRPKEFDCDVLGSENTSLIQDVKKLIINPLELGNTIIFRSKENEKLFDITYQNITKTEIAEEKKGLLNLSDKILKIDYLDHNKIPKSILLNLNDKIIFDVMTQININKQNFPSFYKKESIEINLDGIPKTVEVFSSAPFFSDGEDMIWYDANIGGIINKNLKIMFAVTNFRILLYNFEQSRGSTILLPTLDDVIVMNRRSVSDSIRTGTFVGGGHVKGFGGVHTSYGKSWSKVIGDLVFMVNGQDVMRWGGIADPTGISQMIKSVVKELYPKQKLKRKVKTTVSARDDPFMILKKRFASGEITKNEYEEMKKALE